MEAVRLVGASMYGQRNGTSRGAKGLRMSQVSGTTRMAKAMSHSVRVKALEILNERVASPSDIAEQLGLPVANVAYHVRALLQLGCVEEVDARPKRGAIEHFYRASRLPVVLASDVAEMPPNVRSGLGAELVRVATEDIRMALESGSFQRRADVHMTFQHLTLDEEGWTAAYDVLKDAYDALGKLQEESKARLIDGESGGPRVRTGLTIMHYEAAPDLPAL
jgi:DNA-binding transcriptional ArsR family regulator